MNILFIHQNFPGQFKHLAPRLAAAGHKVVALTLRVSEPVWWQGVRVLPYSVTRNPAENLHPWLVDFETKTLRAEACYKAAIQLREAGFVPDVIVAHPGWGESMFLRDVWPTARIGLYCELYYTQSEGEIGFDPEFSRNIPEHDKLRLRLKNLNNFMHFEVGDLGISPTQFQANTFPAAIRDRISVIHDGIETDVVTPDPEAHVTLSDGTVLGRQDEVITFVNRNLEPYRGYHVFMRSLPRILSERRNARVLILGGDEVSYGARPPKGQTWKQIFIDEVRGKIPDDDWSRVHFMGKVPYATFLSLLRISRAHVYLTYPFVLSWSLLEAMSAGAPIIASDTAPLHEAVVHDKTGRLFPFFDRDRLVEEICMVLDDAELRERLGAEARNFVRSTYDLNTVCLPRQFEWIDRLEAMQPGRITL